MTSALVSVPLAVAVAAKVAMDNGATASAHSPAGSIPWVVLRGVVAENVPTLRYVGWVEFPPEGPREFVPVEMYWIDPASVSEHPYECQCPECTDCCCCGTTYRYHRGEEHSFVSAGWYAVSKETP